MSYNKTNFTYVYDSDWDDERTSAFNTLEIFRTMFAITGTLLNLWFLVAILTSREMRSSLRNKIICNTFVVHLLDSVVLIPFEFSNDFLLCELVAAFELLPLIQDFIANWLVVMLLVVFIAQIQEFNPTSRLTPKAVTVSTIGLLVLPWAASVMVVPIIVHDYLQRDLWAIDGCFVPPDDSYQIFNSVDTAVPILLAVLLLIVAAVLRYRRFTQRSSSDSIESELISGGSQIDNIFVYVVAVIVITLCDLPSMILACDVHYFRKFGIIAWLKMGVASYGLTDARLVFMPMTWLLLSDVRHRIKTYRPWCRPAPGIDLTMTYIKEEN